MKAFVVIATTRRGVVDPPEVLGDMDQWLANRCADRDEEAERDELRRRATMGYRLERDPEPDHAEISRLMRRNVNADAVRTAVGRG